MDILDLDISPFEHIQTLYLRSNLKEDFLKMNSEEQIELLEADLKVIKNANKISNHLSRVYDSQDTERPLSEWWRHLDKVAAGQLVLTPLTLELKTDYPVD